MKSTALLIDGNALIHRAWHALPRLTSPDGKVVNAIYGFAMVLQKVLQTEHPESLVVCWDTPEPTYRHIAAPEYKAQREEQPQEFYDQVPIVKEVVAAFGGKNIELPGYEADDLLATLAAHLAKEKVDVTILTSDRDVWQCIAPRVRVMAFKKGVTETVIYDEKTLPELTGLAPKQIVDWKALTGDPSDNLKGVSGIGDKTALDLLKTHGTLDKIFKAAKNPKSDLKPGVRQRLVDGEKAGRDTLKLVQLMTDAPVETSMKELRRVPADQEKIRELFLRLGFKTLLARIEGSRKERGVIPAKAGIQNQGMDSSAAADESDKKSPSSQEGVEGVLERATTENVLILHPVDLPQASLFAESPVLLLGSGNVFAALTQKELDNAKTRKMLAAAFADPKIKKIGHDLKLAWHWCRKNGFDLEGIAFDTEIAAYLLSAGERSYDLATLAVGRLGMILPEGDARPASEVDAIRALHRLLAEELRAQRLDTVMTRFELPLIPILGEMEERGILIDREYFKKLREEFAKEKARLEREMVKLAGEEFNPASPLQLTHILFDVLKIPTKGIKRGKTGISTAASELEKLEGAHPIIEKVGDYREVAKLLSTYVEALPNLTDKDGRVHTTFNQTIAATGRLSSTSPNLQNIPIRTELGRKIRRGFIAQDGYLLLSCDYSQIELRVIAALAKDEKMLDAFRRGVDIHTATAAAIWHVDLDKVTKDQRRAAKAINFGIIYGQGPQGLSKAAGVPFEEAKQFIAEYFYVYSGVREYLDQTKALAHAQGYVETFFGRRRPLPDINSPLPQLRAAAERMAINMPVQGTATGDLIKLALIALAKELPRLSPQAKILLQVHDEIVFEILEKEVTKLAPKIIDIMENVEKIGVPIVVEAKAGKNWEEMKRV